jgi:O-antigen/teichoic acid export membrane protein
MDEVDSEAPLEEKHAAHLLPPELLKQRVASGVFSVASWGAFNLVVGFFGSIVIARMLLPRDFGLVALGTTVIMFASAFSDGGLASGLIRREAPPTRAELGVALGLQLTLAGGLALIVASIAATWGRSGLVVALMMLALPISAAQTPSRVVLTREVRVRAVATVESLSYLLYYGWAVGGVLAGMGVWALASAAVIKTAMTTIGVVWIAGERLPRPRLRGARMLKPVIAFGLRFQSTSLIGMARDQGLNVGIAVIAGPATLGLWSLAQRVLQFPLLMFEPLHRVSLPYMTQVMARRQEPGRLIDRGVVVSATASGLVLSAAAAALPGLVPIVFGAQWAPAGDVTPWVCAALLVAGPASVAGVGYLYAADAPGIVLRATVLHTIATFAVTLPLLHFVGLTAVGIGLLVGSVVDVVVISRGITSKTSAHPLRVAVPLLAIAFLAGVGGTLVASTGDGVVAALAGAATACVIYVALIALFRLGALRETSRLVAQAVRHGLSREERFAPTG